MNIVLAELMRCVSAAEGRDASYYQRTEHSTAFRQEYDASKQQTDAALDDISLGLSALKEIAGGMGEVRVELESRNRDGARLGDGSWVLENAASSPEPRVYPYPCLDPHPNRN